MRMLLIGMDGAQADTFKRGWTPYLESIINSGTSLPLKEDLISRGWAEIFTGEYASVTGGMYERPVLNGTYEWTDKFKLDDVPSLGTNVKPLWQVLNDRGYRVGIMNVPTTFPAPEVEGFFVSGGGGGGPISQDVAWNQCYPPGIREFLNDMGYILDERLPTLLAEKGLYEPALFFQRLDEMNQKRTSAFIELSKRHEIDFGFIVYKSSIVTTETLALPELSRYRQGDANISKPFLDAVEKFYGEFDEHVRSLVETFREAEVVLVSDHGMAPRRWSVNFNGFLMEKGYQNKSATRRKFFDFVNSFRHLVPYSLRRKLKGSQRIKSAYNSIITFNSNESLAFNITRTNAIHGIYINDNQRFGGPVKKTDMEALRERIVRDFNEHPEASSHSLSARKASVSEGKYTKYFPDIIIDMPDGYMPSNEQPGFIEEYPASAKPLDLQEMKYDKRMSAKAHYPLAVNKAGAWRAHPTTQKPDLRVIHDHVLASFPEENNG